MHALVVDDSKAIRLILTRILTEAGIHVTQAGDGKAALACLDAGASPDVVLIDWNMPEMSGIELVAALRSPPYDSSARLMMVTTETEVPNVVRALDAGADEYVMKPFTKETILDKLRMLGLEV